MTLIQTFGRGGQYVMMMADRKVVYNKVYLDPKTRNYSMYSDDYISEEDTDKIQQLSYFTLVGAGGMHELGNYIKDKLFEEVPADADIEQCREILQKVVDDIYKLRDTPIWNTQLHWMENHVGSSITISGFAKDGRVGIVRYSTIKDKEKVPLWMANPLEAVAGLISPSDYAAEQIDTIIGEEKSLYDPSSSANPVEYDNIIDKNVQATLDTLSYCQALASYNFGDMVSSEHDIRILILPYSGENQGKIISQYYRNTSKEFHKLFSEAEAAQ